MGRGIRSAGFAWALVAVATLAGGCAGPAAAPSLSPSPATTVTSSAISTYISPMPVTPITTSQAPASSTTVPATGGTITMSPTASGVPAGAERVVAMAKSDLAQRSGVAQDQIEVVSVAAVEWPDTSLGCPQPGMMYAQVITPGFRIVLSANGKQYEYHSNRADQIVLCQQR